MAEEVFEADDDETVDDPYEYGHEESGEEPGDEDLGEAETDEAYYTAYPDEEPTDEFYMEAEQQYEDAYATYLDARRQMAYLKAARGFYPVVALADNSMQTPPSSQAP